MPLNDRDYVRGAHPPACTCVSCESRRSGYRPGRKVWRGKDVGPAFPSNRHSENAQSVMRGRSVRENREAVRRSLRHHRWQRLRSRILWFVMAAGFGALVTLVAVSWLGYDPLDLRQMGQDWWSRLSERFHERVNEPLRQAPPNMILPSSEPVPSAPSPSLTNRSQETDVSPISLHEVEELELLVHQAVNVERERSTLEALAYDQKLASIARKHSTEMAEHDYFSHENLAGEGPTERGFHQGYDCRKNYRSYNTAGIAENIFQGWLYSSITYWGPTQTKHWSSQEQLANSAVVSWMTSPGHRGNILNRNYDKQGIGIAISSSDKFYVTQNFC